MKTNNSINENNELKDQNGNPIDINPDVKKEHHEEDLVDKKTLKKYRLHWYQKIPYPVRALFIKYWFFGLNYFLFMMGLGALPFFREVSSELFAINTVLLMFVCGFALGAFNELFVYNILDVIEDYPGQSKSYVLFKSKKIYSLFINIFYGIVLGMGSLLVCGLLASLIGDTFWFREPFSVAVIEFIFDMFVIEIKNLIVRLYRRFHPIEEYEE